jgi:Tol biopolymer transport system component
MRNKYAPIVFLLISLLASVGGCEGNNQKTPQVQNKNNIGSGPPALSYYSNKVSYPAYWGEDPWNTEQSAFVFYDLSTKETKLIIPPIKGGYGAPVYSWDGKKITFTYIKGDNSNVCIMDVNGNHFQQLTNDYSDGSIKNTHTGKAKVLKFNSMPSFSPDGKRIIFARAEVERERSFGRGKMLSQWDIYEIEIETKKVRKLTNYQFYDISSPYYMPDGKRFIFWGTAPTGESVKSLEEYRKRYKDNNIFIMDGKTNELKPVIVYRSWTSQPSVTKDGAILFVAKTNEIDGLPKSPFNYDLFLLDKGKINRITKQAGYIYNSSISMDGKRVLYSAKKKMNEDNFIHDFVVNSDGSEFVEIRKPIITMGEVRKVISQSTKK